LYEYKFLEPIVLKGLVVSEKYKILEEC
jgi:hypothetical protein